MTKNEKVKIEDGDLCKDDRCSIMTLHKAHEIEDTRGRPRKALDAAAVVEKKRRPDVPKKKGWHWCRKCYGTGVLENGTRWCEECSGAGRLFVGVVAPKTPAAKAEEDARSAKGRRAYIRSKREG